ncbi:MAG: phage tail protein [Sciscionella sp.]
MTIAEPTVGVRFLVQVDDMNLGAFDGCEGLGCEVVIEQREEGGNNGYVWQLPSRINYPNITLRRPLGPDTQKVARWIASMTGAVRRRTGNISAMAPDGTVVAKWGLLDVVPVRWQGPSLGPDDTAVMTETVEIAHHGFMDM